MKERARERTPLADGNYFRREGEERERSREREEGSEREEEVKMKKEKRMREREFTRERGKSNRERVVLATEAISVARRPEERENDSGREREKKRVIKREKGEGERRTPLARAKWGGEARASPPDPPRDGVLFCCEREIFAEEERKKKKKKREKTGREGENFSSRTEILHRERDGGRERE